MKRTAVLLLVAVAVAGCTSTSIAGGGEDKPDAVEVIGPTCTAGGQPCSSTVLSEYGQATIRLEIQNNADSKIKEIKTRNLIVGKCSDNIATVKRPSKELIGPTRDKTGVSDPELKPDERLIIEWRVKPSSQFTTLGNTCPVTFELNFKQTIKTSKQIQIKKSRDVPDASSLSTSTTSRRPVRLRIDAPRHFVTEGEKPVVAKAYLQNTGDGEITSKSITITPSGWFKKCDKKKNVRVYGAGERSGQSYRHTCTRKPGLSGETKVVDAVFEATYNYKQQLGTVRIPVRPSGIGG